jgi:hypothetical protein
MVAKYSPEQSQFGNFHPASQYRNPAYCRRLVKQSDQSQLGRVILPENR